LSAIPHYALSTVGSYVPAEAIAVVKRLFLGGPAALSAIYVFLLALVSSPMKRVLGSWLPLYLGSISVGIYLVHMPLLLSLGCHSFLAIQNYLGRDTHASKWLASLLVCIATILFGHLYSRVFDAFAVKTSRNIGRWIEKGFQPWLQPTA